MKIDPKFSLRIGHDWVTDLQVMKSAAGFYIGRSYWDTEFGFEGPYSRESMYYANKEDAEADLAAMEFEVRDCLENNAAYLSGDLPHPFEGE